MKKKIVLIEGIPGSGKSTFARFIANQFQRNGYGCKLYFETTYNHPIIDASGDEEIASFLDSYVNRWSALLEQLPHEEIIVLESAFLQNPIAHLLHKEADREQIQSLIYKVSHLLSKEDCTLIYFYQENPLDAIEKMIERRGGSEYLIRKHETYKHEPYFINREEQGPDSHLSFFHEYALLANDIVSQVSIPTVNIENSAEEYGQYQQQVLNKFNLSYFPDPVVHTSRLKQYAGLYYNKDMDFKIAVELKDDRLWIFGNKRLNPDNELQFYLDDMSVRVEFVENLTGVSGLVITEKDLYANRNDDGTAFERIS